MKTLCIAILAVLPMFTYADDLHVANNSKSDVSFEIDGSCSKDFGFVAAHDIVTIPQASIIKACANDSQICSIKLYEGTHCDGALISNIAFYDLLTPQVRMGVGGVQVPPGYSVGSSPGYSAASVPYINLFVNGPWMSN